MLPGKFGKLLIILVVFQGVAAVLGQYHDGVETSAAEATGCFTPDYTQGLCVPMAKCRRIEWLLERWSPPYPAHIARYVRQSHCGSQGDVHFACCAFYDIKDHHHFSHQPPQIPKPSPSPTFIRNPHHNYRGGSLHAAAHQYYASDPFDFDSGDGDDDDDDDDDGPTINYLQQPVGETILRSTPCGHVDDDRIANSEVVHLSEFPWMVLLESQGAKSSQRFRCAGTLITSQYVLTAAHCVDARNDVISIRLGEHDLRSARDCEDYRKSRSAANCALPCEDVAIETIIRHPDYKANLIQNDIALIRLQRPVEFNNHIKAICLPLDSHTNARIPTHQIVAGWGVTEKGYASDVLLKATIPLRPLEDCQIVFQHNRLSANKHICAGGIDRRSTCRADSGGPLFAALPQEQHQMRYVQFGIASTGNSYSCGSSKHNLPGIYTNVGNYITWIINTIY